MHPVSIALFVPQEDPMDAFRRMSGRKMSRPAAFAAGALVGAITVFVPFATLRHPGRRAEAASRPPAGWVRASAPTSASRIPAGAPSSIPSDPTKPRDTSDEPGCDVQLD